MSESSFDTRRVLQISLVLLALGTIIFAYLRLSQPQKTVGNPLEVIPNSASLTCIIDGMNGSSNELELLRTLLNSSDPTCSYHGWSQMLDRFDSLRTTNRSWYDVLQTAGIAFQTPDPFSPGNWSASIALPADMRANELMEAWLPDLPKREFKNQQLFIGTTASWCTIKNCLVISPSVAVLEDIVLQTGNNNVLSRQESFLQIFETRSKDVPLHIIAKMNDADWLPLEPVFTKYGTLLNGYLLSSNPTGNPMNLAAPGDAIAIHEALPEKTTFLDAMHCAEFDTMWTSLNAYYSGSTSETFWSQAWQDMGDTCQCDLNETLLSWRTGEQGCAVIELTDSLSEPVAYFGIRDTINAISMLGPLLELQAQPADGIYRVAFPQVFQRNTLPSVSIEHSFIMQHNGYLFAAAAPSVLKFIQGANSKLSGKTEFVNFIEQASNASGRLIFQSTTEIALLPSSLMSLIKGAGNWGITTEKNKSGKLLVSIGLPVKVKGVETIQAPEVSEPTTITSTPTETQESNERSWPVINHNTQEKETLRNSGNRLELLGADGKSLWSIEISGPVLGDVLQIDALKNNKLQMAFTTASGLYIIDRNGKALPGFPFLPKPPTTSPLLAADYDKTKKYRLVFGVGDGLLFNLGVDGNPTSGWKFKDISTEKIIAVQTQKIGSDDVIFTFSDQGSIQLLKRTGETKAITNTKLDGFDGKTIEIIPGNDLNTTSIVYSSGAGVKTAQLSAE